MPDDVYEGLRAFLDGFPIGFPKTASGVELQILKRLFTIEEASTVPLLTPLPEDAASVAFRAGLDEKTMAKRLEALADKGLIFRIRRGDTTLFNAVPFMIGLYEYSVQKMDAALAKLYKAYYDEAFQAEMAASDVPGFKVVPINHTLREEMVLMPSCALEERVHSARVISVAPCICRQEGRLTDCGCDHPLETCLHFGAAAEFYIENGIGRGISAEEAMAVIRMADEAGLVHAGVNTQHLSNLCNCCPCCCASMKGITRQGHDKHGYLNALFEAVIDADSCTGCGICEERCPVKAVTVPAKQDHAGVDNRRCLGCGLCSTACPAGAVTMRLRAEREEPFQTVVDLGLAIWQGKNSRRA